MFVCLTVECIKLYIIVDECYQSEIQMKQFPAQLKSPGKHTVMHSINKIHIYQIQRNVYV